MNMTLCKRVCCIIIIIIIVVVENVLRIACLFTAAFLCVQLLHVKLSPQVAGGVDCVDGYSNGDIDKAKMRPDITASYDLLDNGFSQEGLGLRRRRRTLPAFERQEHLLHRPLALSHCRRHASAHA